VQLVTLVALVTGAVGFLAADALMNFAHGAFVGIFSDSVPFIALNAVESLIATTAVINVAIVACRVSVKMIYIGTSSTTGTLVCLWPDAVFTYGVARVALPICLGIHS